MDDETRSRQPPRLAVKLLEYCLEKQERDAVLSELAELFRLRSRRFGIKAAHRWYWRQPFSFWIRLRLESAKGRASFAVSLRGRSTGRRKPMDSIRQDLRNALRFLGANRGLALIAVVTLAVGIGANSAIFSVVNGVLLKSLPYQAPNDLFRIYTDTPPNQWPLSVVDFQALREQATSFSGLAAYRNRGLTYTKPGLAEPVAARLVTADFFSTLKAQPLIGRTFHSGEDDPGVEPVAVISHGFWNRHFGGDSGVLGKSVHLDGTDYTVVGVMPEAVGPLEGTRTDVWPILQLQPPRRKGPFFLTVIVRLKSDTSLRQAEEELGAINRRLFPLWQASYQDASSGWGVLPLREFVIGDVAVSLYVMLAAVGLVLLIASINVGSLLVARTLSRRPEIALRAALGASRWRIFRHLMSECLAVAALGCVGGAIVGYWSLRWLLSLAPTELPRVAEISLDLQVIGFTMLVSLLSGLLFGLAPAYHGTSGDARTALDSGGRTASRRSRLGHLLVVSQYAMALPVLISAGLLVNSFLRLQQVDPGFDANRVVAMQVALSPNGYPGLQEVNAFWDGIRERIEALPGVAAAGINHTRPLSGNLDINNFDLESRPTPVGKTQPNSPWMSVTPSYFRCLGIPLLKGRLLEDSDRADAPPVVVVDRAWARRHLDGQDPIGERFYSGGSTAVRLTIVGMVGDVKNTGLDQDDGTMYFPYAMAGYRGVHLFVRTETVDPMTVVPDVRRLIAERDPTLAVSQVMSGNQLLTDSLLRRRYLAATVSLFAAVALGLATIGIYGVMSYFVQKRTREIGVRMALGGGRRRVSRWVVLQGMRLALTGIAVGLPAAFLLTSYLSSFLFGIGTTDPATYLGLSLLLTSISLLACTLPAIRATKVDPIVVLRSE